ncbi:MAG TPA: type I-E CRISPR-associated protein Cse1/CasA [Kouleothrix sp.]|uniref:type I-E CRISPR-associated protein Cse1/CasA n=1 Tax=Kouleothrix sp. TaxID=2779161 RepID=UPI002CCCAA47|nr:type I-E CRISPR-associated protein Cse1/CasA [Kouleothrix sp.]HRC74872.1 type I-E CRISPR-associated protein Cse1/CasA [Kouleothrix sp.]
MTDFNLWRDPWIRALDIDGKRAELGIYDLLARAHRLRALYDPSPLTVAGIHRLLTAVLQAIYDPWDLAEIADVLEAGQLDRAKLDVFGAQHGARFGLFDPVAPFMQTSDAPAVLDKSTKKTVAYLMAEVPSGTNRTHFQHVNDAEHQLCPACCARALVTIPAFASSGGAGIKPSINGVPPIYLLPIGSTLAQTLALALTTPGFQPKIAAGDRATVAAWSGATTVSKNAETDAVGYLESLTFPARRMRLQAVERSARCTRCGTPTDTWVSDILYEMGLSRRKGSELWRDPFAAYYIAASSKEITSIKPREGRSLWREYGALFLSDHSLRPPILSQLSGMVDDSLLPADQLLRFRCIGLRTDGKAKNFEWFDDALEVPPALLRDQAGAELIREMLARSEECGKTLGGLFTKHLRPNGGERTWFNTLRDRMQADYWARLAQPFHELVGKVSPASDYPALARGWAELTLTTAEQAALKALDQVGDQSDLLRRRVLAEHWLRSELNKRRKEWTND